MVLANPKFESGIFLMGGLHICVNFLKSISQHMDSAGLDDLWTEAGVYGANTMLLCCHRKPLTPQVGSFRSWLDEYGHEHDVAVEEFVQSVGKLLKKYNNADDYRATLFIESTSCQIYLVVGR